MAESMKVFELAKELDIKALELIDKVKALNLKLKNHMSDLTAEQVDQIKSFLKPPEEEKKKAVRKPKKEEPEGQRAPGRSVVVKRSTPAKVAGPVAPVVERDVKPSVMIRKAHDSILIRKDPGQEPHQMEQGVAMTTSEMIEPTPPQGSAAEELFKSIGTSDAMVPGEATEAEFLNAQPLVQEHEEAVIETAAAASTVATEESNAPTTEVKAAPAAPAAPVVPTPPVVAAAPVLPGEIRPVRRGPKYSIIRVVSPETPKPKRPLIVEDAPPNSARPKTTAPKTFTDPVLARTGTDLIRDEAEEERKKKSSLGPRVKDAATEGPLFKSTDYLRRERVYQPKKKKISLGRFQNKTNITTAAAHKRMVDVDLEVSVDNMAHQLSVKSHELVRKLKDLGITRPDDAETLDDWMLDMDTAQIVAAEYQYEIRDRAFDEEAIYETGEETEEEEPKDPRSAVVTIMGHVDHGKTSLLDIIRRARVAQGEAGGITQHIGAYTVNVNEAIANLLAFAAESAGDKASKKDKKKAPAAAAGGKKKPDHFNSGPLSRLTFLDTPGHAAFTEMRSRGAKVTDIVVLVVSAVDGVMPQTREAVDHAKAAGVPIIVAVNKMDLPEAQPDRIKQQLAEFGIQPEDWGGENIFVEVSAKTGLGVDKLLEMIQLQAELLQLKARSTGAGEGSIVEAKLDKGRGPLATVLVSAGTLNVGDYVVAGDQFGRVRALIDDKGKTVKQAGPSDPVEILGLAVVPDAGDPLNVVPDERAAKALVEHRRGIKRQESEGQRPLSLEDLYARMAAGDLKELPVILKSDVKGSAEAIQASLQKLPQDKVRLKLLSVQVGGISESDVLLASASKAIILGFNVRPDAPARNAAERLGVQIKPYSIIYNLIDEVRDAMEGLLDPTQKEVIMGRAQVRNVFTITKVGTVAGSFITDGKIQRNNQVRLIRDSRVIYTGKLSGLKRFKDDAKEVASGFECGISIEGYNDIKVGDEVEAYTVESIRGVLTDPSLKGAQAQPARSGSPA